MQNQFDKFWENLTKVDRVLEELTVIVEKSLTKCNKIWIKFNKAGQNQRDKIWKNLTKIDKMWQSLRNLTKTDKM